MQRANPSWAQFSARPRVKPRTYFQRSRPREAAEQYLKVTTDYAKSQRAPESMVRLGQTLAALSTCDDHRQELNCGRR
jgi:TolA-binding protein